MTLQKGVIHRLSHLASSHHHSSHLVGLKLLFLFSTNLSLQIRDGYVSEIIFHLFIFYFLFFSPRRITVTTVGRIEPPTEATNGGQYDQMVTTPKSHRTNIVSKVNPTTVKTATITTQLLSSTTTTNNNAAFLEESTFESQNADSSSFESFFQGDTSSRFSANNITSNININSIEPSYDDFKSLSLGNNAKGYGGTTPTKQLVEALDMNRVSEKHILDDLSDIYSSVCLSNLVPNLTLELFFLFTVLTTRLSSCGVTSSNDQFIAPFTNIESYVYFAVRCIEKLRHLVVILDRKTLTLLFENSRLQHVTDSAGDLLEYLEQEIALDESFNLCSSNHRHMNAVKSPITGIAFQTESDNRKNFVSDRHFYSFSKKRDAFYSIVRQWEENIGDPEWNMTSFLTKKVGEFMRQHDGLNNDLQFARLFIAQLLEMSENEDFDKTDEADISEDGVLRELKKRDPLRFQSLQNRLTGPSSTCEPCPKLTFTKVEEFFKEFIRIADSYSFNTCLLHEFVSKVQSQDANNFGLNQHSVNAELNRSDFSETLWHDVKTATGQLRLCAKFLGYILFLPYHAFSGNKQDTSASRLLLSESFDLKGFLEKAVKNHRLLITLPWTVDLLSMADKSAFDLPTYKEPLFFLLKLYKQLGWKMRSNDGAFLLNLTLTLHIGWLFDQNPWENFDFYENISIDSLSQHQPKQKGLGEEVVGLDDIVVVDKSYVYMICPYLKVIKKPLGDFKKKVRLNNSGNYLFIYLFFSKLSDLFSFINPFKLYCFGVLLKEWPDPRSNLFVNALEHKGLPVYYFPKTQSTLWLSLL